MLFPINDRIRVSRVEIAGDQVRKVYRQCWISVDSMRNRLGIWMNCESDKPEVVVPLAEALIEWTSPVDIPPPMPT